jgi:hypothetical protein
MDLGIRGIAKSRSFPFIFGLEGGGIPKARAKESKIKSV